MRNIKLISTLAAVLVSIVATLAFILSYSSLQHMANANGVTGWLSYLWPLLLDFSMIVFSLAILRANLRGESAFYPWLLTIVFATLATLANVLDVHTLGIPAVVIGASVKAIAPVALVLSFELLMSMVKAEVKRSSVVKSLSQLAQELEQKRSDLDAKLEQMRVDLDAKLERMRSKLHHRFEQERSKLKNEIDQLTRELNARRSEIAELNQAIEQRRSTVADLDRQIDALQRSKNAAAIVQHDALNTVNAEKLNDKQVALNVLLNFYRSNPTATLSEAGDVIERSKATVSNYLNELEQTGLIHRNGNGVEVLP